MLTRDVELVGQDLTGVEIDDLVHSLTCNKIRVLCVRGCTVSDGDFQKLMKAVGLCQTLLQLNCALGIVNSEFRLECLAQALTNNTSLYDLFLHSNPIGDEGANKICHALIHHPKVISLDIGDCELGDCGLEAVSALVPSNGPKLGLQDLVLSANTSITAMGWAKFAISVSRFSCLRSLYVDYNDLGDYGVGCLIAALAAHPHIEYIDFENTAMTQHSADLLLYMVKAYPVRLKKIILSENDIHPSTIEAIKLCIDDVHDRNDDINQVKMKSIHKRRTKEWKIKQDEMWDNHGGLDAGNDTQEHNRKTSNRKMNDETSSSLDTRSSNKLNAQSSTYSSPGTAADCAGSGDADLSPVEDYEEMKEIPYSEIKQPRVQPWISLSRPV